MNSDELKMEWIDYRIGDSRIKSGNYILVYCPNHPHAKSKGHVYEHRYMMEMSIGRFLLNSEHVHHKDGNGNNNSIDNLEITNSSQHGKIHNKMMSYESRQKTILALKRYIASIKLERKKVECGCGCKQILITPDSRGRYRKYIQGHNVIGKHWKWNNE
jgi:hypothetical protein